MSTLSKSGRAVLGLACLVLIFGLVRVTIAWRLGYYDDDYRLSAVFATTGQTFPDDAEVNVRGVEVGKVVALEVVDEGALVTLSIDGRFDIPADTTALIRAKSLLGPKYVDLEFDPTSTAPRLANGDRIERTETGFDVVPILGEAYDTLAAVDPRDVATVFTTLSDAAAGQGETFGRAMEDAETLTGLFVANEARIRRLLAATAALSDELEGEAEDIVALSDALADAAAPVGSRPDAVAGLLADTERLYHDVADLLEDNRTFLRTARTDGAEILDAIFDRRDILVAGEDAALQGYADYLTSVSGFVSHPVPWRAPDAIAYREIFIFPQTICQLFLPDDINGRGACSTGIPPDAESAP